MMIGFYHFHPIQRTYCNYTGGDGSKSIIQSHNIGTGQLPITIQERVRKVRSVKIRFPIKAQKPDPVVECVLRQAQ